MMPKLKKAARDGVEKIELFDKDFKHARETICIIMVLAAQQQRIVCGYLDLNVNVLQAFATTKASLIARCTLCVVNEFRFWCKLAIV